MTMLLRPSQLGCPPRWGTPRSPERETLGPRVGEVAELLGDPLLPHQQLIADVALEIDPHTGLPAYGTVIVVGPRQVTGKTHLLMPVMTHRCMGFGPGQRVLYTTQTASKAREKWEDVHVKRLLASPLKSQIRVRYRLNAEAIQWPNGSSWSPGSTTAKTAGTGDTLDLPVIDEAWSREDNRTEMGLRPAMMTRPSSQLWVMSMVPGPARVKAGIRRDVAYFEWAAPLGADPGDPATWWSCMPALGHTVTEAKIRGDYEAAVAGGTLADFYAEYLGWWMDEQDDSGWDVFDKPAWLVAQDPKSVIVGDRVFAVESSHDLGWLSVGVAGRNVAGLRHLELVARFPSDTGRLVGWLKKPRDPAPAAVVIDPSGPAGYLIGAVERECGITVVKPLGRDVAGACGSVYVGVCGQDPATRDVRVRPSGGDLEAALNEAARRAVWRNRGDARVFDRRVDGDAGDEVDADVAPVMAVTLADWGLAHAPRPFNPAAFSR